MKVQQYEVITNGGENEGQEELRAERKAWQIGQSEM